MIRDVTWLYFLHYVYNGKMPLSSWKGDNRMGVTFDNAMLKFPCVQLKDGVYYSSPNCEKIIDEYFGTKTFEESVEKCAELKEYNTKSYPISKTPYDLYMRKHPKLDENFDRIRERIRKHYNSQRSDQRILSQLYKSRNLKEWNFKTCFDMFKGEIPELITIYRGIKNKYKPDYAEQEFTCWTTNIKQGERFAKYYFTGGYQFKPDLASTSTLLIAKVPLKDISIFIGGSESEVIMKGKVKINEIIDLKQEINETNSNIKSFDYQAVTKNENGEPILFVVDYLIIKNDVEKVECKIKGYQYTDIDLDGETKKGWIKINDFIQNNRTHLISKTDFKIGSDRRKIYDIMN